MILKKHSLVILSIPILAMMTGCGPSADQITQEKQHLIDSTLKAVNDSIQTKIAADEADRLRKEEEVALKTKREDDKRLVQERIVELEATLEVEKSRLQKVKEFQLGRTPTEKDQQIKAVSERIARITFEIEENITALTRINNGETYQMPTFSNSVDTTMKVIN